MLKENFEGTPALRCPIEDMAQAMGTLSGQHDIQQGSYLGKLENEDLTLGLTCALRTGRLLEVSTLHPKSRQLYGPDSLCQGATVLPHMAKVVNDPA